MKRLILTTLTLVAVSALLLAGCASATPTGSGPETPATPDGGYPTAHEATLPGEVQPAGELWLAYPPAPEDASRQRAEFFVDAVRLTPSVSIAGGFDVVVEGSLPTPCHLPRVSVTPPDQQNQIMIDLYTLIDSDTMCAQVIEPFAGTVATLTAYPPGNYSVLVNGQAAGQMSIP